MYHLKWDFELPKRSIIKLTIQAKGDKNFVEFDNTNELMTYIYGIKLRNFKGKTLL